MKTVSKIAAAAGLAFGFSAVNAGQRNVTTDPELIVVSTEGSFRVTSPVSRVLGLNHGGYIMFVTNVDNIDAAIRNEDDSIVQFCKDNGLELGSAEASIAIHKELDMWGIAKGIAELDSKGNARTITERLSKADKEKFVLRDFDSFLEQALEGAPQETIDALSRDGITKEEQVDILVDFVQPRELPKFKGSKLASPANIQGAVNLTFTDSNVWNQLKADLGEDATSLNRIFEIDVEAIQKVAVNNGYEDIECDVLVLGASADKAPARAGSKEAEAEAAGE